MTPDRMQIPVITNKQKAIIYYLFPFRFLNTHQIQTLLEHKNANRTLSWLKDLIDKKYIKRKYERKSFIDNTKPAIYFLGSKARKLLLLENKLDTEEAKYIYQEHKRKKKFINRCIVVANVYLYLLSQKEKDEKLEFFTSFELKRYEYFPDPLPDAFITLKKGNSIRRYFLDYFEPYTPFFVARKRVKKLLEYADGFEWSENTDNAALPSVLFVCHNKTLKNHIYHYARALLEKSYDDKISFFLTTEAMIMDRKNNNIWGQVEHKNE